MIIGLISAFAVMAAATTPAVTLNLLGEGATDLMLDGRPLDHPDDPRPRERVVELRAEAHVRLTLNPRPWMRATLSAFAAMGVDAERPPEQDRFYLVNGTRGRALADERLGEASVQLQTGPVALRVGKQFVHWGAAPFLSPNDVLGAVDFRRGPFPRSADPDANRLSVWAVNPRVDVGRLQVEGMWLPFFQPNRLSLSGDDFAFFGAQSTGDPGTGALLQRIERDLPLYVQRRSNVLAEGAPAELAGGQLGARVLARGEIWQMGVQYVFGVEPYPVFKPNAPLLDALTRYYEKDPQLRDPRQDFDGVIAALEAGQWFWSSRYRRMHQIGAQAALTLGDFHVTMEASFSPRLTVYARSARAADARMVAANTSVAFAPSERLLLWGGMAGAFPFLQGPAAELVFGWTRKALAGFLAARIDLPADFRFEGFLVSELDQYSLAGTAAVIWRRRLPIELYLAIDIFGGAAGTMGSRWTANDQMALGGRVRY